MTIVAGQQNKITNAKLKSILKLMKQIKMVKDDIRVNFGFIYSIGS